MEAPQVVMVGLMCVSFTRGLLKHGESDGKVSFTGTLFGLALQGGLLWWGGFWS